MAVARLDLGILVIVGVRVVHIIAHLLVIVFHDQAHVPDGKSGKQAEVFCEIKVQLLLCMEKEGKPDIRVYVGTHEIHICSRKNDFTSGRMIYLFILCRKGNKKQGQKKEDEGSFHFLKD